MSTLSQKGNVTQSSFSTVDRDWDMDLMDRLAVHRNAVILSAVITAEKNYCGGPERAARNVWVLVTRELHADGRIR